MSEQQDAIKQISMLRLFKMPSLSQATTFINELG